VHYPIELNLPIGRGGVAMFPGDMIVGDCDCVVVVPVDIVDEIAQGSLATTLYDEFAEEKVALRPRVTSMLPLVW
jgi:regulator of RNase E activity RraA